MSTHISIHHIYTYTYIWCTYMYYMCYSCVYIHTPKWTTDMDYIHNCIYLCVPIYICMHIYNFLYTCIFLWYFIKFVVVTICQSFCFSYENDFNWWLFLSHTSINCPLTHSRNKIWDKELKVTEIVVDIWLKRSST